MPSIRAYEAECTIDHLIARRSQMWAESEIVLLRKVSLERTSVTGLLLGQAMLPPFLFEDQAIPFGIEDGMLVIFHLAFHLGSGGIGTHIILSGAGSSMLGDLLGSQCIEDIGGVVLEAWQIDDSVCSIKR